MKWVVVKEGLSEQLTSETRPEGEGTRGRGHPRQRDSKGKGPEVSTGLR